MDRLIFYLILLSVLGIVAVYARRSRKKFEEKHGVPTTNEKWQSLGIFILWISLFFLGMYLYPTAFGWTYILLFAMGAPFIWSKPSRKLIWRIQESGMIAFFIFGPFAFFYYFG